MNLKQRKFFTGGRQMSFLLFLFFIWFAGYLPVYAKGRYIFPPRIGEREFVLDEAGIIKEADRQEIKKIADKCLTDRAVPIIVVTLERLYAYGASGEEIEEYARALFDEWGIGQKQVVGKQSGEVFDWNYGMLLLVSRGDRKARIELGADWGGKKNRECEKLMQNLIVPAFREGNYSKGILLGVKGLDAIARDLELPSYPRPWWYWPVVIILIILIVLSFINMIQSGTNGWGWALWAFIFTILGIVLYIVISSHGSSRGARFGGGSFGGGRGGGGGATGSW